MDETTPIPQMTQTLRLDELVLRRLTLADLTDLHAIFADPETHTIGDGPVSTLQETRGWLENRAVRRRTQGVDWYGVRTGAGELIGDVGVFLGRTVPHPEIGFEVRREHQGRGVGRRIAAAVVAEAHRAGFVEVWATVRTWNTASLRCLDHVGFTTERVETDGHGELVYLRHTA